MSSSIKFDSFYHHIPPRKLLNLTRQENADMCSDSPRFSFSGDTLFHKFLPFNNAGDDGDGDGDGDLYSSDHFRMYEFKVRRCTRSRSHDWTDCPFAHPGEKARRRDPCRFHYSGEVCPEFRRGGCSRGESCEFAHGVFECWLHPARYRTEACKDGKNCKRKVCFFAHSPRQLRLLPNNNKNSLRSAAGNSNHCCLFCHCGGATSSPTSTLLGMSHLSPPHSPGKISLNGVSPVSRYNGAMSYKDALTELMSSLESMNIEDANAAVAAAVGSPVSAARPAMPWIDVSSLPTEDQLQFILSPSAPNISGSRIFSGENVSSNYNIDTAVHRNKGSGDNDWASGAGPDLGWVNDLLM